MPLFQDSDGLISYLKLTSATALVILFVAMWPRLVQTIRLNQIPLSGKDLGSYEKRRMAYLGSARKVYTEGYRKVCRQTSHGRFLFEADLCLS